MDPTPPGLTWAIVDGVPRHVSEFASLRPGQRPRAICPQCARRLTLKLGSVKRHHAAHMAGDVCAATQPETALHLDTKLALAAALLRPGVAVDAAIAVIDVLTSGDRRRAIVVIERAPPAGRIRLLASRLDTEGVD